MHYVIYRYYKNWFFGMLLSFSILFEQIRKLEIFRNIFWCNLYNKLLFWIRLSDSRFLFLYIWSYFKDIFEHFVQNTPEVWTIFVRTIFWYVLGCWVLNGPSHQGSCSAGTPQICNFWMFGNFVKFRKSILMCLEVLAN